MPLPTPLAAIRCIAVAAAAFALAGCQSAQSARDPGATGPEKRSQASGVEAVLMPVNGSAAQGSAKFVERGEGLVVLVVVNNVLTGTYRVAVHERGNCSSPNGFSAGRPWAPPGSATPAGDLMPAMTIGANGNGQMSAGLRGVRLRGTDSLEGRSVMVHAGASVDADVVPGRPNRIVLCGVIGPVRSLMDAFR
ncbi:Superoxide dismutase [Cu-Zn] [Burkholderiales bacterium]|nr:Superoxide dismutase [Cu-Zn] [Burkholderiales bacterium]